MRKILILLLINSFFLFPDKIIAADPTVSDSCTWTLSDKSGKTGPPFELEIGKPTKLNVTVKVNNSKPGDQFKVYVSTSFSSFTDTADSNGSVSGAFYFNPGQTNSNIILKVDDPKSTLNPICQYLLSSGDWFSQPTPTPQKRADCELLVVPNINIKPESEIKIRGKITNASGLGDYEIICLSNKGPLCNLKIAGEINKSFTNATVENQTNVKTFTFNIGRNWPEGNYNAIANVIIKDSFISSIPVSCSVSYNIPNGIIVSPTPLPSPTDAPVCKDCGAGKIPCTANECMNCSQCRPDDTPIPPYPSLAPLCDQLPAMEGFRSACWDCLNQKGKIWTAIGCVPTDLGAFLSEYVFKYGIGFAGGIAFLYFIYGAFIFMTSGGTPERIGMAKEIIMSSLLGLFLIIFSVFLLKIIGVDILRLPGFSY